MHSNAHAHLLYSWAILMKVSAIALRRLARANELLLEIVTSLTMGLTNRTLCQMAPMARSALVRHRSVGTPTSYCRLRMRSD